MSPARVSAYFTDDSVTLDADSKADTELDMYSWLNEESAPGSVTFDYKVTCDNTAVTVDPAWGEKIAPYEGDDWSYQAEASVPVSFQATEEITGPVTCTAVVKTEDTPPTEPTTIVVWPSGVPTFDGGLVADPDPAVNVCPADTAGTDITGKVKDWGDGYELRCTLYWSLAVQDEGSVDVGSDLSFTIPITGLTPRTAPPDYWVLVEIVHVDSGLVVGEGYASFEVEIEECSEVPLSFTGQAAFDPANVVLSAVETGLSATSTLKGSLSATGEIPDDGVLVGYDLTCGSQVTYGDPIPLAKDAFIDGSASFAFPDIEFTAAGKCEADVWVMVGEGDSETVATAPITVHSSMIDANLSSQSVKNVCPATTASVVVSGNAYGLAAYHELDVYVYRDLGDDYDPVAHYEAVDVAADGSFSVAIDGLAIAGAYDVDLVVWEDSGDGWDAVEDQTLKLTVELVPCESTDGDGDENGDDGASTDGDKGTSTGEKSTSGGKKASSAGKLPKTGVAPGLALMLGLGALSGGITLRRKA